MDKLGCQFAEKYMGFLAYVRLNMSHQWALSGKATNSISGCIKLNAAFPTQQVWILPTVLGTSTQEGHKGKQAQWEPCGGLELLLSNTCTAARTFLHLSSPHLSKKAGVLHEELGGETAGTADSNWPDSSPTPQSNMINIKSWGKKEEMRDVLRDAVCLPNLLLYVMELRFTGDSWRPAWQ